MGVPYVVVVVVVVVVVGGQSPEGRPRAVCRGVRPLWWHPFAASSRGL